MTKVYSQALNTSIEIERVIGNIKGTKSGSTFIFIAGIHGNEPSGIFALKQVLDKINSKNISFTGNCYAIAGNLTALKYGVRYRKEDLNRIWTSDRINTNSIFEFKTKSDEGFEQYEILSTINQIINKENGPFYFIDLHTTSSKTRPFITINDTILNRKFTQQFPVPLLLGIEEYLSGTLFNYINQLGYLAFGFEAGQHDELTSIKNNIAFIYLTFFFAGSIKKTDFEYDDCYNLLANAIENLPSTFEIIYHHKIAKKEDFKMMPGYTNFQLIKYGQPLAKSNSKIVSAALEGNIFMPLYQSKGEDGFFIIKPIKSIFLSLSTVLRTIKLDYFLAMLPGISWDSNKKNALRINLSITRFLAKKIFHLLGYRSKQIDKKHLVIFNREAVSKKNLYKNEKWN